jgi:hypothetical protein
MEKYLGAFAYSRKATLTFLMSFLPSICQHFLKRLTLDGIPQNLMLKTFMKIYREHPNIFKIGRDYRALYRQLQESLIAAGNIMSP